jgi:RNA polymerase sigma-70 factor (ECF subfamily)
LLRRILKNEMEAEEAVQDAFLKAYNSLNSFRKESKFSTWLYRIVYNTGLTIVAGKKRKIEKEMSSIDDVLHLGLYDDEIYSKSRDVKEYLSNMVEKLPVRNALVLILFYIDNFSLNEISQVMGISLVNTKVLLHRARNSLKDMLLKHNFQEELL